MLECNGAHRVATLCIVPRAARCIHCGRTVEYGHRVKVVTRGVERIRYAHEQCIEPLSLTADVQVLTSTPFYIAIR